MVESHELCTQIPRLRGTHVLWPPESHTRNSRHPLQSKRDEGLPRLALRARLNLVKSSLGGGILIVVVVVAAVVMVVVIVTLVVRVVGVDFLDGGRHLEIGRSASAGDAVHPGEA